MNTLLRLVITLLIGIALVQPAYGDETKPLESPIHMTYLPVPDEFHTGENQPVLPVASSYAAEYSHADDKAPEKAIPVQSTAMLRDDSDANLEQGGRR